MMLRGLPVDPADFFPALRLVVLRASEAENRAHEARLHAIHERAGRCLWYELEPSKLA